MPICSRCGNEIEFRYIKGRCIPLHLYGGGCSGSALSDVYDYPGYSRSKEGSCFLTNCPACGDKVYFIRHNGGSVWIDPPLGPPWYKHCCMDKNYVAAKGIRSLVVTEIALTKFRQPEGLILGIVKEAEASASKRCSLINIETGKDKSIVLLAKNNAGFLVGHLVIYDQHGKSVSLVENDSYTFRVIARLKPRLVRPDSLARLIECPECLTKVKTSEISGHLKQQHWFPQTIVLEKEAPDKSPILAPNRGVDRSTKITGAAPLQLVCPNPSRWNGVFTQLVEFAEVHSCSPRRPPTPLILAGWTYSNDTEKMRRWTETVDWASANGCAGIVEGVSDQEFYQVEIPTSYLIGPMGGPCYRPWDFEEKVRPSDEVLAKHFEYLSAHWADTVGSDLSTITRPVAFTGKKARRLLVQADDEAFPPWGGWSYRASDEARRRSFTRFRSAVNKAIGPHEVDHIKFVTKPPPDPLFPELGSSP
jgi:hypothetical protein